MRGVFHLMVRLVLQGQRAAVSLWHHACRALGEDRALLASVTGVFLAGVATSTVSFLVVEDLQRPRQRTVRLVHDASSDASGTSAKRLCHRRSNSPRNQLLQKVRECIRDSGSAAGRVAVDIDVDSGVLLHVTTESTEVQTCVASVAQSRRLPQQPTSWRWVFQVVDGRM